MSTPPPPEKRPLPVPDRSAEAPAYRPGEVRSLGWEGISQVDVVRAMQGHVRCYGSRLFDLEPLLSYREAHPEVDGVKITLTGLYVLAAGLALREYPRAAVHLAGYREYHPKTFDIGLSVAGEDPTQPLAPTVLIKDVLGKNLSTICAEIRTLSIEARKQEAEERRKLARMMRFLPFGFLRRALVGWLANDYRILREKVGCFQISNLQGSGLEHGISSVVPHTLLMPGEIREWPMVVNGQVLARRGAWMVLHFNHAEVVGAYGGMWLSAFHRWIADPAALYAYPDTSLLSLPSEPS